MGSGGNRCRDYGARRALDGFSLEVPRGGVFGILGPNGSGKSTFIAMLAAMEQPGAGELQVLLPGESAAPGTGSGKTGTPTAQVAGVPFTVTVMIS